MPQISGLKWKDQTLRDLDAFRERKLKMTKKDDLEDFGDIGGAASLNIDSAMIARFLREECEITGHNLIDQIQTFDRRRRDEGGHKGIAAGLYSRFYDWICMQNPAAQLVSEDDVRTACRKIVRGGVEIKTLRHVCVAMSVPHRSTERAPDALVDFHADARRPRKAVGAGRSRFSLQRGRRRLRAGPHAERCW